ncbi:hypothetical protein TEA_030137 [Camellia sinensis var. sinensis]|uniref:GATA-type domain-containing protein n=1 Tax=Camellia sinensis var. sinensis TaxID=542762 RepID=A0A4S4EM51_CAMSN|nr:hypothetical protein TEA_030137 [Camellia sinensis var. sinensis]
MIRFDSWPFRFAIQISILTTMVFAYNSRTKRLMIFVVTVTICDLAAENILWTKLMQRKKGQFTSAKKCEESASYNTGEDSGQDDSPPETICTHCGTSSKSTPMMRRGPDGPRTLCNACGLFWANKRVVRSIINAFTASEEDYGILAS